MGVGGRGANNRMDDTPFPLFNTHHVNWCYVTVMYDILLFNVSPKSFVHE